MLVFLILRQCVSFLYIFKFYVLSFMYIEVKICVVKNHMGYENLFSYLKEFSRPFLSPVLEMGKWLWSKPNVINGAKVRSKMIAIIFNLGVNIFHNHLSHVSLVTQIITGNWHKQWIEICNFLYIVQAL